MSKFPSHELERPRADRHLALLVSRPLRHNCAGAVLGEAAQERRVDAVHLDDDGEVVGRLDRRHIVEHLEIDRARFLRPAAVKGIFDVRRRHGLAVVELDARPKVERVGEAVRTLIEALGEARDHREIFIDCHDRVVDVLQHADRRGCARLVDVQILRRLGMSPNQRSAFDRLVGGSRRTGREAAECGGSDQCCARRQEFPTLHGISPSERFARSSNSTLAFNSPHLRRKFGADGGDA